MAVATDPGPAGAFAGINRSCAGEIETLWSNRQRASTLFVAIHARDVPFFRWNESQGAHRQSATGNSADRLENASQSLKTDHELTDWFPRRRFSAPIR